MESRREAYRGMRYLASELDYRDGPAKERFDVLGTAEILTEHRQRISVGSPGEAIDELSGSYRQLLEAKEYHAVGRTLLKKITPEEELDRATDFGGLPPALKEILGILEVFEISTAGLREQIRLADGDETLLQWVIDNFGEFIDRSPIEVIEQGYERNPVPPRDSYKVVERFYPSQFKEASERRISHLKSTLHDIDRLYTILEVERHLERIRDAYREDQLLIAQWTQVRKEEDRILYLQFLRRQSFDLEAIRRKLWATFDRERESKTLSVEAAPLLKAGWVEHMKDGKVSEEGLRDEGATVVTEARNIPPCIWDLEKSKAFCELNQTRPQWRQIYSYLWEKMGSAILSGATSAKTEKQKDQVRRLLGKYQYRLDKQMRQQVITALIN